MHGTRVRDEETAAGPDAARPAPPDPGAVPASGSTTRSLAERPTVVIAVIVLVGLVVPVVIAQRFGALGALRGDDWSYLRTLFRWVDTGELSFNNWVSMTLVGQLALAAPIAAVRPGDIAAVQLATALVGLVGLGAVFAVARQLLANAARALLVTVVVAVGPLWAALTVSYMTDVPAFAFSMVALWFALRAFERSSTASFVAAMATALFAFTIRQYAVVPMLAIALVGIARLRGSDRERRVVAWTVGGTIVAAAAFYLVWRTIPDAKEFAPSIPDGHALASSVYKGTGMFRLVGLLVAPVVVLVGPVRIVRRSWAVARDTTVIVGVGTAAVLGLTAVDGPRIAFAGNYIVPDGILANAVSAGRRPDIMPESAFALLVAIGTIAATLLAIACVPLFHGLAAWFARRDLHSFHPGDTVLGLTIAGYVAGYGAAVVSGLPLYDRYVLPVVPLAGIALLRTAVADNVAAGPRTNDRVPRRALTGIALSALAAVGLVYAADSASFDGTRWDVANAAMAEGWTEQQIRGGFEWINYHGDGVNIVGRRRGRYCVALVVNPTNRRLERAAAVVARDSYHSPLTGSVPVVALLTRKACRPGAVG